MDVRRPPQGDHLEHDAQDRPMEPQMHLHQPVAMVPLGRTVNGPEGLLGAQGQGIVQMPVSLNQPAPPGLHQFPPLQHHQNPTMAQQASAAMLPAIKPLQVTNINQTQQPILHVRHSALAFAIEPY
jgi:hypothetical protein